VEQTSSRWASHGWIGLILIAISWPLNWFFPGLRTHYLFFPLWLGYILVTDAAVRKRRGDSLLGRLGPRFPLLFLASAPAWWLFELVNLRTGNWVYLGRDQFTDLEFFLWSTLNFSIVVPAVFETAELVRSFDWPESFSKGPVITPRPVTLGLLFASGVAMLALLLAWPRFFFPLTWLALLFLLEPLCHLLGRTALLRHVGQGDWRPVVALAAGALVCGFFWELWNYFSYPKWVYRIPFFDYLRLFEMPALGYLGYLPFGVELYPLARLLLPRKVTPEI
jgi:hypothetical protein